MPYIGRGPELGVRSRFIYTATAGQTSFSGNDDAGISLAYTDTLYMDVYQNGVLLVPATDYAASTGTSVVLVQGASVDDTLELLVFDIFSVADSVSAKDGGSFAGNVGMGGTLSVTGASTLTGVVTANAGVVVDNITIDGTTIALSSGNMTIDVAGDINIDAGGGNILFKDDGTAIGRLSNSSSSLDIRAEVSDADMKFTVNDGGSNVVALTLDGSAAGAATFNSTVTAAGLTVDGTAYVTTLAGQSDTNTFIRFDGSDVMTFRTGNSERMKIDGSGDLFVQRIYDNTTSGGGNVRVQSDGLLQRDTSSRRYKNTIEDATHGLAELLTLRTVTYKGNNDGDTVFGGLIAEEVHDAGLTEFVQYNDDNEPEALAYGNMVSLCIKALQELSEKNDALEARITALEA